ncbi:hypothetical protein HID58_055711 [Brassica napus]|uniref:Uncharacterized protein n=1 Tax=Brassica napus TaxID=3708 RepID=A0ABQ8AL46_BRANA|nr:hypothetical protein HID58_055711 [Brassica napus]
MRTYPNDHPRRLGKIWHFVGSTLSRRKVEFKQPVEVKLLAAASTGLTVKIVLEYVIRRKLSINHIFIQHKMLTPTLLQSAGQAETGNDRARQHGGPTSGKSAPKSMDVRVITLEW